MNWLLQNIWVSPEEFIIRHKGGNYGKVQKFGGEICGRRVRETICASCIHRDVCLYKQTYLEYLRACEKMRAEYPEDISFIEKTDPNCIHYKKKSDVN